MNVNDVVAAIQTGKFSQSELERLQASIRHHQEDLALQLKPGDRVITNRNVRPRYLAGRTGRVRSFRGERIMVLMDQCEHYRVSGREWRMTPGSFQKIEQTSASPEAA